MKKRTRNVNWFAASAAFLFLLCLGGNAWAQSFKVPADVRSNKAFMAMSSATSKAKLKRYRGLCWRACENGLSDETQISICQKVCTKEYNKHKSALKPADSDNDGTPDSRDKCPIEYGPKSNNGCPKSDDTNKDSDNDGIPDSRDKCPDKPETKNGCKDRDGCPDKRSDCGPPPTRKDRDGDGVPDYRDKCPDVKGPRSNRGCPKTITNTGMKQCPFLQKKVPSDEYTAQACECPKRTFVYNTTRSSDGLNTRGCRVSWQTEKACYVMYNKGSLETQCPCKNGGKLDKYNYCKWGQPGQIWDSKSKQWKCPPSTPWLRSWKGKDGKGNEITKYACTACAEKWDGEKCVLCSDGMVANGNNGCKCPTVAKVVPGFFTSLAENAKWMWLFWLLLGIAIGLLMGLLFFYIIPNSRDGGKPFRGRCPHCNSWLADPQKALLCSCGQTARVPDNQQRAEVEEAKRRRQSAPTQVINRPGDGPQR